MQQAIYGNLFLDRPYPRLTRYNIGSSYDVRIAPSRHKEKGTNEFAFVIFHLACKLDGLDVLFNRRRQIKMSKRRAKNILKKCGLQSHLCPFLSPLEGCSTTAPSD